MQCAGSVGELLPEEVAEASTATNQYYWTLRTDRAPRSGMFVTDCSRMGSVARFLTQLSHWRESRFAGKIPPAANLQMRRVCTKEKDGIDLRRCRLVAFATALINKGDKLVVD